MTESRQVFQPVYPIVVMKLEVKESSENLSNKQLLPTPVAATPYSNSTTLMQYYIYVRHPGHCWEISAYKKDCKLTTVANQQKLDKVVIVLPSSGGSHVGGRARTTSGHDRVAVPCVTFSSPKVFYLLDAFEAKFAVCTSANTLGKGRLPIRFVPSLRSQVRRRGPVRKQSTHKVVKGRRGLTCA